MNINLSDLEPITIDLDESNNGKSTNFGGGIELLMNEKNKGASHTTNIDLGDVDKLENDLNDLSSINLTKDNFDPKPINIDLNFDNNNDAPIKLNLEDTDSKLGEKTADSFGKTSTWDGFKKFTDMPSNDFRPQVSLSDREMKRKKRHMLKCINEWQEKGFIKEASRLNIDSEYDDIEDEYESAVEDKRKKDSVKIQQNWMITMINTIEYGNSMFDPFGISLDGWGESVSEDIDSYDEIFGELYEKYKGGKMSPELSLLLRLGFSASVIHFSNKALSSATPGFNDVIKQSPELMRMFTNATVDSMKQNTPGMAFAEELLNTKPDTRMGPPPAPKETREMPPPTRPGAMQFTEAPGNRPDLRVSKGTMFAEGGVDINNSSNVNEQVKPILPNSPPRQEKSMRPEMSGPRNTDVDNILSGLKTRNVDIHSENEKDSSIISVNSLSDLDGGVPRKSKRRNRSDKKVVSLDI